MATLVPYEALDRETLRRVLESFASREGTDYGPQEFTMEEKVTDLLRQLKAKEAFICYEPESDSITLLPRQLAEPLLRAEQGERG